MQDALDVAVVARAADVVQHLVVPALAKCAADASADVVERFLPRDSLPLPGATRPGPPHGMQYPLGIIHLVQRRRALGAVAPAAGGVMRVALELRDLAGGLVDPC